MHVVIYILFVINSIILYEYISRLYISIGNFSSLLLLGKSKQMRYQTSKKPAIKPQTLKVLYNKLKYDIELYQFIKQRFMVLLSHSKSGLNQTHNFWHPRNMDNNNM